MALRPPGSVELVPLGVPAPAELPAGAALLPRRAHALNGAGQQTTARRHRGLLQAVSEPVVLVAGASTHSCSHQQALYAAVSATHPVQSTGKGHRVGGRSVSDRRPESLAGASCPRRGQPLPSAGPWATIHHRARSRDFFFRKSNGASILLRKMSPLIPKAHIWKSPTPGALHAHTP